MDYKISVYPSSEKDLMNIKVDHKEKQIKVVQQGKLKDLYKKKFGEAVKKFNDYALKGKIIDYHKAICDSNIPEVYRMSVVVRFDLAKPNEVQLIQKSFTDFKKRLDEQPWMAINSVYWMSVDEFKELNIFFVPISSGYVTDLSMRNDLIDVTKTLIGSKDNINILKAMPLFVQQIDAIWKSCADSSIVSQDELEQKARIEKDDPASLHSIEIGILKENMNHLQRITHENQMLEAQVDEEKRRIQKELVWTKEAVPMIQRAEKERLAAIERARIEAARAEKERIAAEQRAKEERIRAEQARLQEAARLKEQARKNYDLRSVINQDNSAFATIMNGPQPVQLQPSQPVYQNPDLSGVSPFYSLNGMTPVEASAPVSGPVIPVIEQPFANFPTAPVEPPAPKTQYISTIPNEVLLSKVQQHCEWMRNFGISENLSVALLPKESLNNIQRLVLRDEIIVGFKDSENASLVGAQIFNCIFENCEFTSDMHASVFVNCEFVNCRIRQCKLEGSGFKNITCKNGNSIEHVEFKKCTAVESDFSGCKFIGCTSTAPMQYNTLQFIQTEFQDCDLKRNLFTNSNFSNAIFTSCDARAVSFNDCVVEGIQNNQSLM